MPAPTLEALYSIGLPSDPAISPDGLQIAYVLTTPDRKLDRDRREIWVVRVDDGARELIGSGLYDSCPVWSSDGFLAFLREQEDQCSIMLAGRGEGEPRVVAVVPHGSHQLVWSPDGGQLAFVAPVRTNASEDAPIVADRLDYRSDGSGLVGGTRGHLHVVDVATGEVRQLTKGRWNVQHPAWSPAGTARLLFTAGLDDDADLTGAAQIHVVNADVTEPVEAPTRLTELTGPTGPATWSPDGRSVVVVGSQESGAHNLSLLKVALGSGEVTDLTAELDRMVMPGEVAYPGGRPAFSPDERLYFCARDEGHTGLYVVDDLERPSPRRIGFPSGTVVSGLSLAAGRAAVTVASPETAGEVAVVDLDNEQTMVLTDHLRATLPDVDWMRPVSRDFVLGDGTRVQGIVVRAESATAPGPLLLDVHGGPHNSWSSALDAVHLYHQVLAAEGWTVLLLNPRGSDGRDDAFLRGALGRWGYAEEADLLEPVDQLVAEGVADPDRLSIVGYSYGGFTVCHLTARTGRFAAAIAGGLLCDLRSFSGSSDLGHHYAEHEFGGLPGDCEYDVRSPIELVGRVSTPTLILHGAADDRCPVGQAEQWFAALREGGVPSQLVLYPGASHAFIVNGRPSQRHDYNQRICSWLRSHEVHRPAGVPTDTRRAERHWQQRLSLLADRHQVPGATLGILHESQVRTFGHGVASTTSRLPVTPTTRFQIGSITKVWTATLAMALVDEGLLDLDEPVRTYLPGLDLGSEEHTALVTMRHLLDHTSGLDGDIFTDTGRGDDALERYVRDVLPGVKPTAPVGDLFSYCNSGFSVAGRVIEALTGMTWDEALRERLIGPLGLRDTGSLPEQALLGRVAIGHIRDNDGTPRPTSTWSLPRSGAPAGAVWASAGDVLEFVRLHLDGGVHAGSRLLSADGVKAMQEVSVDVPNPNFGADSWCLGWMSKDWHGRNVIGHDGGTIGQTAFLRVLPTEGIAIVLLTNGGDAYGLYRDLLGEVLDEVADVKLPAELQPAERDAPGDVAFTGRYVRDLQDAEVTTSADGLRLRVEMRGELADLLGIGSVQEYALRPTTDTSRFLIAVPGSDLWSPVAFLERRGRRYLHQGLRAAPLITAS